jgi:CRISPR/Cas system CMR subunit Cmr6 (Cas7 group RAMP superfamily)
VPNNKQLYKALGFFRAREIIIEIIEPLIKEANMLINWSEYPYSLESACQLVKETMYFRHPYLSEKALKGIVNNFAFNNK